MNEKQILFEDELFKIGVTSKLVPTTVKSDSSKSRPKVRYVVHFFNKNTSEAIHNISVTC